MTSVLICEDEPELAKVLKLYLEKAGYSVFHSGRGDTGLVLWEQQHPDLVLLDLNLPGRDGLDVAREIRRQADTPIIMVTARADEVDRLIGLELGADDYIIKPYSPREVVARVKAVLRRSSGNRTDAHRIEVMDLVIDVDAFTVTRNGKQIPLTPSEFRLLHGMASQPGRVFTRLQLLEQFQGSAYEGYERTIDAHIKNLRAKLEHDPHSPGYIETVFGVGYKFVETEKIERKPD